MYKETPPRGYRDAARALVGRWMAWLTPSSKRLGQHPTCACRQGQGAHLSLHTDRGKGADADMFSGSGFAGRVTGRRDAKAQGKPPHASWECARTKCVGRADRPAGDAGASCGAPSTHGARPPAECRGLLRGISAGRKGHHPLRSVLLRFVALCQTASSQSQHSQERTPPVVGHPGAGPPAP